MQKTFDKIYEILTFTDYRIFRDCYCLLLNTRPMLNRVGVVRNDVSNVIMDGWMDGIY